MSCKRTIFLCLLLLLLIHSLFCVPVWVFQKADAETVFTVHCSLLGGGGGCSWKVRQEAGLGRQSLQTMVLSWLSRKGTEKQDWTKELETVMHIWQTLADPVGSPRIKVAHCRKPGLDRTDLCHRQSAVGASQETSTQNDIYTLPCVK